jgi:hypothetical protein
MGEILLNSHKFHLGTPKKHSMVFRPSSGLSLRRQKKSQRIFGQTFIQGVQFV